MPMLELTTEQVQTLLAAEDEALWVAEEHCYVFGPFALRAGIVYRADNDNEAVHWLPGDAKKLNGKIVYNLEKPDLWQWRPPNEMPCWAARINLGVRREHDDLVAIEKNTENAS